MPIPTTTSTKTGLIAYRQVLRKPVLIIQSVVARQWTSIVIIIIIHTLYNKTLPLKPSSSQVTLIIHTLYNNTLPLKPSSSQVTLRN